MKLNQYALYRVDLTKPGRDLWHQSYEYARKNRLQIRVENYRQQWVEPLSTDDSAMKLWNRNRDRFEISDVIVLNRDGELTAFYVSEDYLRQIAGFIRFNTSGAIITESTTGYHIADHDGNWLTTDYIIIDGKQYFLLEHEEFRDKIPAVILDAYGKIMVDQVRNGFDDQARQQIREQMQPQDPRKNFQFSRRTKQLEIWQKYYQNGEYLRSAESGGEANYDMIDGRVNNQVTETRAVVAGKAVRADAGLTAGTAEAAGVAGKADKEKEKPEMPPPPGKKKKRSSVIKKLHQKQIDIAIKSGKPVPKYLEQNLERNK